MLEPQEAYTFWQAESQMTTPPAPDSSSATDASRKKPRANGIGDAGAQAAFESGTFSSAFPPARQQTDSSQLPLSSSTADLALAGMQNNGQPNQASCAFVPPPFPVAPFNSSMMPWSGGPGFVTDGVAQHGNGVVQHGHGHGFLGQGFEALTATCQGLGTTNSPANSHLGRRTPKGSSPGCGNGAAKPPPPASHAATTTEVVLAAEAVAAAAPCPTSSATAAGAPELSPHPSAVTATGTAVATPRHAPTKTAAKRKAPPLHQGASGGPEAWQSHSRQASFQLQQHQQGGSVFAASSSQHANEASSLLGMLVPNWPLPATAQNGCGAREVEKGRAQPCLLPEWKGSSQGCNGWPGASTFEQAHVPSRYDEIGKSTMAGQSVQPQAPPGTMDGLPGWMGSQQQQQQQQQQHGLLPGLQPDTGLGAAWSMLEGAGLFPQSTIGLTEQQQQQQQQQAGGCCPSNLELAPDVQQQFLQAIYAQQLQQQSLTGTGGTGSMGSGLGGNLMQQAEAAGASENGARTPKPHPNVERARRDVINNLIDELRVAVPPTEYSPTTHYARGPNKTDRRPKAAVLRETIQHLDALKQRNMQLELLLQARGGQMK